MLRPVTARRLVERELASLLEFLALAPIRQQERTYRAFDGRALEGQALQVGTLFALLHLLGRSGELVPGRRRLYAVLVEHILAVVEKHGVGEIGQRDAPDRIGDQTDASW